MILLDTNAILFLLANDARGKPLRGHAGALRISPVSTLEVVFLEEIGRIYFPDGDGNAVLRSDPRWMLDDPPLDQVFARAASLRFTRDPFDRLLAAHALARGFRLATADRNLLAHLPPEATLPLATTRGPL